MDTGDSDPRAHDKESCASDRSSTRQQSKEKSVQIPKREFGTRLNSNVEVFRTRSLELRSVVRHSATVMFSLVVYDKLIGVCLLTRTCYTSNKEKKGKGKMEVRLFSFRKKGIGNRYMD